MADEQKRAVGRTCANCAWSVQDSVSHSSNIVRCLYEPAEVAKLKTRFCRHHSFSRGWRWGKDTEGNLLEDDGK